MKLNDIVNEDLTQEGMKDWLKNTFSRQPQQQAQPAQQPERIEPTMDTPAPQADASQYGPTVATTDKPLTQMGTAGANVAAGQGTGGTPVPQEAPPQDQGTPLTARGTVGAKRAAGQGQMANVPQNIKPTQAQQLQKARRTGSTMGTTPSGFSNFSQGVTQDQAQQKQANNVFGGMASNMQGQANPALARMQPSTTQSSTGGTTIPTKGGTMHQAAGSNPNQAEPTQAQPAAATEPAATEPAATDANAAATAGQANQQAKAPGFGSKLWQRIKDIGDPNAAVARGANKVADKVRSDNVKSETQSWQLAARGLDPSDTAGYQAAWKNWAQKQYPELDDQTLTQMSSTIDPNKPATITQAVSSALNTQMAPTPRAQQQGQQQPQAQQQQGGAQGQQQGQSKLTAGQINKAVPTLDKRSLASVKKKVDATLGQKQPAQAQPAAAPAQQKSKVGGANPGAPTPDEYANLEKRIQTAQQPPQTESRDFGAILWKQIK